MKFWICTFCFNTTVPQDFFFLPEGKHAVQPRHTLRKSASTHCCLIYSSVIHIQLCVIIRCHHRRSVMSHTTVCMCQTAWNTCCDLFIRVFLFLQIWLQDNSVINKRHHTWGLSTRKSLFSFLFDWFHTTPTLPHSKIERDWCDVYELTFDKAKQPMLSFVSGEKPREARCVNSVICCLIHASQWLTHSSAAQIPAGKQCRIILIKLLRKDSANLSMYGDKGQVLNHVS